MYNEKKDVIVICGPTASGKTKLGIELARNLNGEIISADSMQIYKDMDIGTAKPTLEERQMAVHHLVDFVSPDQRYSVADFKKDAVKAIEEIISRNKIPIIVGGTGLYINSLIYNIDFKEEKTDLEYRKSLEGKSVQELYEMALKIDPEALKKISENDRKRITRILEIYHTTGKTKTELEIESRKEVPYNYHIFVLSMDREMLYERINRRVDMMIEQGLIEEVQRVTREYDSFPTAMQGLGYKEVVEYLENKLTKEEMIEKIKQESRRYAKRQLTWFRAYKQAVWLDGIKKTAEENVQIILENMKRTERI